MSEITPWPWGGGETGALIRGRDWRATPLGPAESWPPALRTAVDIVVHSPDPAAVVWGPARIQLYNDAYAAILQGRHPAMFGGAALEGWPGARAAVGPVFDSVFAGGAAAVREDVAIGAPGGGEGGGTRWFTFTFCPIHDERGGVAGVFHRALETTGRKRAEAALRESEERHRLIVESARDYAILTVAPDRAITSWSPGAQAVYGWEAHEAIGRDFSMLFVPEDREAGAPAWELATALDTGVAPDVRWHLRADGSRVFVDGVTRALRGPGGALASYLKVGQDVTGRRQTEDALRESEERNRLIVENALDYAIITMDAAGRVESWSPGAEAVYGWTAAEIAGQPVDMTFTPEDRAAGAPGWELETARRDGAAPDVRWHLRRDGSRVFIDGVTRALGHGAGGGVYSFLKVGQDVTARREMEEALRESEARFRTVANLVPDLLWQSEPDGATLWYNERWYQYTGHTPAQSAGFGWVDAIHPDDREGSRRAWSAALAEARPLSHEHRIRGADGHHRWFLVRGEPVRDPEGRTTQWIGAATNVHAQRLALEGVERRVAAATAELAGANAALGESEERFRSLVTTSAEIIWSTDARGTPVEDSPSWRAFTGQTVEEWIGPGRAAAIHPDDRQAMAGHWARSVAAEAPLALELRVRHAATRTWRWVSVRGVPLRDAGGRLRGWFGTGTDVDDRRRAQEARLELLRQLVTAEEDERRRISRELHDQMGQQVTALLLGLKALRREGAPAASVEALERLADGIARDMQAMALELRPPALDTLGLAPALRNHLEEWSRRHAIACDFHAAGLGGRLPPETETTVYRVVQEGLTNVLKHAGATRVNLVLERRRGVLSAILEDDGRGFDVDTVLASPETSRRLGVRGMRERVALLGGELQIESAPGAGTTLFVRLPDAAAPPFPLPGGEG